MGSAVQPRIKGRDYRTLTCHRSFVEEAPNEAAVLTDLKIAAYAQGADGITAVKISKESGLNRNCWYVLGGTAQAFTLRQE